MSKEDIVAYQFTSDQSRTKAAANGRKGGKRSGEVKRERKTMKESASILLSLGSRPGKVTPTEKLKTMSKDAIEKANLSQGDLAIIALINQTKKGKTDAMRLLREILGEDQPEPTATVSSLDGLAEELAKFREEEEAQEDDSDTPAD